MPRRRGQWYLSRMLVRTRRSTIGSVFFLSLLTTALVIAAGCSSEAKLGEECDEEGQTEDVCVSGAVCGKNTSGQVLCLKICTQQSDCAANEECNGVGGEGSSVKGCRLKK